MRDDAVTKQSNAQDSKEQWEMNTQEHPKTNADKSELPSPCSTSPPWGTVAHLHQPEVSGAQAPGWYYFGNCPSVTSFWEQLPPDESSLYSRRPKTKATTGANIPKVPTDTPWKSQANIVQREGQDPQWEPVPPVVGSATDFRGVLVCPGVNEYLLSKYAEERVYRESQ